MASKTTYIPRYLLPQYGALWRTATRSMIMTRPLNPELGQVMVRYASKTAASKSATKTKTTITAAAKVAAPKAASTKAASKTAAAKAAKHSAPTKPPAKTSTTKVAATQAATPKTPTPKTATPPATPEPANPTEPVPAAPASESVLKTEAGSVTQAPTDKPTTPPQPADPSKPLVLEKPERFNPPSHGQRLPRSIPKHYGGALSDAELQAQTAKAYPGLPPPENTWAHWFLHSRGIHLFITLGTLTGLAVYTFIANFNAKSPFAELIPPISEFPRHPFQYLGVVIDVMRMHEERESALTAEKRRQRVEDVAKRNEYRKAHGLEPATGLWGSSSSSSKPEPEPALGSASQSQSLTTEGVPIVEPSKSEVGPAAGFTPDGKRKKFLGIF
ncbi:hypothetical protein F5Y05DRAFT_101199 [Hypoxylon sp. FL0543]|nr:hypothetical protein F5Y05DRAFT_101199 [Hypoxylon sp. FL0543]